MPAEVPPLVIAVVENDPSVAKDLRRECQIKAATNPAFGRVEVSRIPVLERADALVCNTHRVVQVVLDMRPGLVVLDLALVPLDFENQLGRGRELTGLVILQDLLTRLPGAALVVFSSLINRPDVYRRLHELRIANPQSRMEWLNKQFDSWPGLIKRIEVEIELGRKSLDVPSEAPLPPVGHDYCAPTLSDIERKVLDRFSYLPGRGKSDDRKGKRSE